MKTCVVCRQECSWVMFPSSRARACSTCAAREKPSRPRPRRRPRTRADLERRIQSTYGIGLREWDAMLIEQAGRCAICDHATPRLYVDHSHITEKVRGLLCSLCNTGLGQLGDNVAGLRRALAYLEEKES